MDTLTFKNIDARLIISEFASKCIDNGRLKEAHNFIYIGDHLFKMQEEYKQLLSEHEALKLDRLHYRQQYLKSLLEIKRLTQILKENDLPDI